MNEAILDSNDKGESEKNRKRKLLQEKSGTQVGKIINTEHKRSKLAKIMDQRELKDCKEACCTNLRVISRTKKKCNCTVITTTEALEMPFITLHNRKEKYIKNNPCPVGSISRKSTINQIKKKFLRGDGPMIKEFKCNKLKDKEVRILRMWHYLDNTAFIIKQTGTRNDITKLFSDTEEQEELEVDGEPPGWDPGTKRYTEGCTPNRKGKHHKLLFFFQNKME